MHDAGHAGRERKRILAGVHEERDGAAGTLRFGNEDRLLDGPVEVGSHVADHADDRPFNIFPAVGVIDVDSEPPAERRTIGELTADDLLADDRDRRRVGRIGIGEVASGDLWNAQRGEEVRRDGPDVAGWELRVRRPRLIDAPETRADAGKWNGHARRSGDRLYAGERSDSGHRIAKKVARRKEVVAGCR